MNKKHNVMKMNQRNYYPPKADLLEVEIREGILDMSNGANFANTAGGAGGKDSYNNIITTF